MKALPFEQGFFDNKSGGVMGRYIMALDQGTTSSRCILFDKKGNIISKSSKEYEQIYPKEGWVEHNPMEIWSSQLGVAIEAMAMVNVPADDIEAIGITNQRETTIIWDKKTGKPVYNAIVWQCRRTADSVEKIMHDDNMADIIKKKTGLIPDAYFSATKIAWILDKLTEQEKKQKMENLHLEQLIHGLSGILLREKFMRQIIPMLQEQCCLISIHLSGIKNLWNILIFLKTCCRRLSHQAVYMVKLINQYLAVQL